VNSLLNLRRFAVIGSLCAAGTSFALGDYIGVLAPFVGVGIDSNKNATGQDYLGGLRFESVTIENHLSVVVSSFISLGVNFPDNDAITIDHDASSLYLYVGGVLRYEDSIFELGENKNATGLYYDIGIGAYYGRGLRYTNNGSTISLTDAQLSAARSATQVIDPVIDLGLKLVLDFNKSFGVYPFIDYELIPFRSYFKTTYTDSKIKQRVMLGMGFAFAWDD
jgi:hypothetical protein